MASVDNLIKYSYSDYEVEIEIKNKVLQVTRECAISLIKSCINNSNEGLYGDKLTLKELEEKIKLLLEYVPDEDLVIKKVSLKLAKNNNKIRG